MDEIEEQALIADSEAVRSGYRGGRVGAESGGGLPAGAWKRRGNVPVMERVVFSERAGRI